MSIILDIIAGAILVHFSISGWRKGLILTAAGLVITIIAAVAAWGMASKFDDQLANAMESRVIPTINSLIAPPPTGATGPDFSEIMDMLDMERAADEVLQRLGFRVNTNNVLIDAVIRNVQEKSMSFRESVISTVTHALSFAALFTAFLILFKIALQTCANIVSRTFMLPVLKQFDSLGGLGVGVLQGLLVLSLIGWATRFAGAWIPSETVGQTMLFGRFMNLGLLDSLSKLAAERML